MRTVFCGASCGVTRGGLGGWDGWGEQVADGVGEILVGAVEQQGDVPDGRCWRGSWRRRGMPEAADAVGGGPEEFADRFGGGGGTIAAEELLGGGEDIWRPTGDSWPGAPWQLCALGAVDAGAGFEGIFAGREGRSFCFGDDAAANGDGLREVLPEGRLVGDGDGRMAEVEVGNEGTKGEDGPDQNAKEEAAEIAAGAVVPARPFGGCGPFAGGGGATGEGVGRLWQWAPWPRWAFV